MHECPYCGMECDCDGEDHGQYAPPDCQCECEVLEEMEDAEQREYAESLDWDTPPLVVDTLRGRVEHVDLPILKDDIGQ